MNVSRSRALLASAGCLLAAAIWGFAFVVVKDSLDVVPPVYMVAIRFTLASTVLALIFWKRMRRLTRGAVKAGAFIGLSLAGGYIPQTIGCAYTTAGKNAFLTAVYVIIVPFLFWIFDKKRPGWACMLAAFLCLTGIGLLSIAPGEHGVSIGDVLTLISGVSYAVQILLIKRYAASHDPIVLTVVQFIVTALAGWLAAPFYDGTFPVHMLSDGNVLLSVAYLAFFASMFGILLQNVCMNYAPPIAASILLSMEALFGVLFSCLLLHETLSARMWVGCALMFAAVLLAEVNPGRKRLPAPEGGQ